MKVTMFWHGGSSYGCFDVHNPEHAEVHDSIKDAKRSFANKQANWEEPSTPCVSDDTPEHGGPEAWLFLSPGKPEAHPIVGEEYPNLVMNFGPRGGIRVYRA